MPTLIWTERYIVQKERRNKLLASFDAIIFRGSVFYHSYP